MVATDNGWPAIAAGLATIVCGSRSCRTAPVPVATVLQWTVRQYAARVEPVVTLTGHRSAAVNAAAGGIARSNHLSGTAIDINGFRYPYEYTHRKTWRPGFSGDRLAAVRSILADAGGVLRWGGDFAPPRRDEMHWEIAPGTTTSRVAALAAKITEEDDDMFTDHDRAALDAVWQWLHEVQPQVARIDQAMTRPRLYKIEGTAAACLDLGAARRYLTLGQHQAMGSPPIAPLPIEDIFWRLPLAGTQRESYKRQGQAACWVLEPHSDLTMHGQLHRRWPGRAEWEQMGWPQPAELPDDHPVWSLPTIGDLPPEGA